MTLRTRLLLIMVSTVAVIVTVLFALELDSLTRNWLAAVEERSTVAGTQIGSLISESTANAPPASLAEMKRIWNETVATNKDLADFLVKQVAIPNGSIVEINVIGEDGKVVVSSVPSRVGQPAPVRKSLHSAANSGFWDRLAAITTRREDYETRIPIGMVSVADQPNPVFEVQLLVSSILLHDRVKPDLQRSSLASLLSLLAMVALSGVTSHIALRPVRQIGKAIDTLSTGRPLGLSWPKEDRNDREVAAVEYKLSLLGEQMQGARRDADQMRTDIGKLTRGVAHEIKNPLNAISLRLESLRMRIADEVPDAEADIELVSNEVHRLDRVVRTFLDLNRPMEPEMSEFDPAGLVSNVIEIMRPAATQANVELRIELPARPFVVKADRGLLEQGLLNIVTNAIQAVGGNGGGWVAVSVSSEGENCTIVISDNGPGMPEDVCDRIFDPYFTTKAGGSGIGLAFTKRAVELHGGRISVETAPGKGTRMTLSFPVAGRPSGSRV